MRTRQPALGAVQQLKGLVVLEHVHHIVSQRLSRVKSHQAGGTVSLGHDAVVLRARVGCVRDPAATRTRDTCAPPLTAPK